MNTVSEAVARPTRTAVQGGAGWIVTEMIDAFLWDMNDRQYGILVIFAGVVFSWAQTLIENRTGKGLLRKVEVPPRQVPVVDERGQSLGYVIVLALAVIGALALIAYCAPRLG